MFNVARGRVFMLSLLVGAIEKASGGAPTSAAVAVTLVKSREHNVAFAVSCRRCGS